MAEPADAEAQPGELPTAPDPVARVRAIAQRTWLPAMGCAVILGVLAGVFSSDANWGDVATWVLAVTTLLAFIAAAFAGVVAYDLLKIEAARDRAAAQDRRQAAADRRQAASDRRQAEMERAQNQRHADIEQAAQRRAVRRAQANHVTAWFVYYYLITGEHITGEALRGDAVWGGAVKNASDLPIFDVRLFYYRVHDPRDGSPWTGEQVYASVDIIRVIPPEETRNQELPARVRDQYETCSDQDYVVGVEFTDASGTRWFRNERAALSLTIPEHDAATTTDGE